MSIGFAGLHLLLPTLTALSHKPKARILVLGTMDLLFTYPQLVRFFEKQNIRFNAIPDAQIRKTTSFAFVSHADWWKYRDFLHQQTLFNMLGFDAAQINTMDVDDYERADIIHDLNKPLSSHFHQFDLILDLGTLEHVFDVRQSLWNLSAFGEAPPLEVTG